MPPVRVHIGSDHAGFDLKQHLVQALTADGHDVVDHGPVVHDPDDDYPAFCLRAALGAREDAGSLGVVVGGSGNGEQIAANKVPGVRAVLAWSEQTARLGRQHLDLPLGGERHAAPHDGLDLGRGQCRHQLPSTTRPMQGLPPIQ